jgi:hypothetical protein
VPELSITLAVTDIPAAWGRAFGASFALILAGVVLIVRRAAVWQTTLQSAWWWSLAALIACCGVEVAASFGNLAAPRSGTYEAVRFGALTLSLCPMVAVLGAKRPQERMWNFVVGSLWAVLTLPSLETLVLHPGQQLNLGAARGWFLWIPILLVPINYLPTRFWLAAALFTAGQVISFRPYLAPLQNATTSPPDIGGLLMMAAAAVAVRSTGAKQRVSHPADRLWLDFRNWFGLLWGLRVQERLNASFEKEGAGNQLTWSGFQDPTGVEVELKSLLRRFVSSEWIEERLVEKSH